mgnify:FL=1
MIAPRKSVINLNITRCPFKGRIGWKNVKGGLSCFLIQLLFIKIDILHALSDHG